MKRIALRQVSRVFGRTFALHKVSLDLDAGSATGLLGENGAGKTTLLNILATLDSPSSGTIHYDGLTHKAVARRARRAIGWVSHDPLVYQDLTGRENLAFYANMYGLSDQDAGIDAWFERIGLTDAQHQQVHSYSRGMIQRLTVARALLHDPKLLLLDEPLTGLDRQGRFDMIDLFSELRKQGKLLILSTHDLQSLGALCDRLVVLKSGRLSYHGDVDGSQQVLELYEAHA